MDAARKDDSSLRKWLGPYSDAAQALDDLRRAVAELLGADPEEWPSHHNAPLAIAATVGSLQMKQKDRSDRDLTDALKARDYTEDMADQLAAQIAAMTGVDIGEHSSANDPWRNALAAADGFVTVFPRRAGGDGLIAPMTSYGEPLTEDDRVIEAENDANEGLAVNVNEPRIADASDAADARRFRWLCDQELPDWTDLYHQHPDRVRDNIDAARAKETKDEG